MKKVLLGLLLGIVMLSFSWPKKLEQKVNAAISKTFSIQEFKLEPINVENVIEQATIKQVNQCLYNILQNDTSLGYIYVGDAPSMKNLFDFAIIFSQDLEIVNTKVLIYREKHGRQIGKKRWLKQFFGMKPGDKPFLDEQIDGISGATISAKSMTSTVRDVLSTISYLRDHEKL